MAIVSDLSASMSKCAELLQQMIDTLDRMNGVSLASSSSGTPSATSASITAATAPAAPPTPAASSAPSTTTSSKSFAPTPATTLPSARATAVVPAPYTPTTVSTPPTTAVAISFRLPTPPFLAATKKIKKRAPQERRARTAVSVTAGLYHAAEPNYGYALPGFGRHGKDASVSKKAGSEVLAKQQQALPPALPQLHHGLLRHRLGHGRPPRPGRPPRLRVQGLGMRPRPWRRALRRGLRRPCRLHHRRSRRPACSMVSPSRCTARSPLSMHSIGSSTTTTAASPTARTPPASITHQDAYSVVDWSTPAILSRNAWKVFDELSTQQEPSRGGILPVTNMLRLPTISSMVVTNKNTATPFFALKPVQLSTSLFNAIKFAMPPCTWVFSGTCGMQMLESFGDHVVFDRGKHLESLLRPFHPTNSTLSAAVPVKLLWSSTQTRMVFLQDADIIVLPEMCAVQEQFCWYQHIPSMSVHEDDQAAVGLFVYIDVLFPWISGNCPVTGFALWDPGGVVLQSVWPHMLEISCHFILVLLVEFWNPMWLPIFTFKMQWLLLNQSLVGVGDVSAAMKLKLFWSSPHLIMMLLQDFCWWFNCPRSVCISCNIILMGGSGSISYQLVTCWSYKREGIMLLWSQQQRASKTASVMLQVAGLTPLTGNKLCKSIASIQTVLMLHDVDTFRQDKLHATSDRVLDHYRRWVNDLHLFGSEYCSTSPEHPIFIFLDVMENSSVILPIQRSENDAGVLTFGQLCVTGEFCTDLMSDRKEIQWKPPWLSMQFLLSLMVPLQLCSHPVRYQLHQSKWIPVQFSSADMSQALWDPGGFKSGLRASRILSGGECHIPGSVGCDTWVWVQTSAQLFN